MSLYLHPVVLATNQECHILAGPVKFWPAGNPILSAHNDAPSLFLLDCFPFSQRRD